MPNTLNELNGSQLQAIQTQGIDINKDHLSINLDFKDPDTNLYFDPVSTTTTVTFNGSPFALASLKILVPLSRRDDSAGVWGMEFLTTGMTAGTWVFTFTGQTAGGKTVSHVLTFTAADTPVEQYFIGALRAKLCDKRASRYIVDDNMRWRWTNGELYSFLDDARLDISNTPPYIENTPFNVFYSDAHTLLFTGGFIFALESRGILETFNAFQYNDELSLNISRKEFFQNAQSLKTSYETSKLRYKRQVAWTRVRGIGMASGRFPLYFSRVLSLLPNLQNTFGGV
jgi:hypothetical protein